MSRRGSACGVVAVMAVLANGLPFNINTTTITDPAAATNPTVVQCLNDGPVQALLTNLDSAESFCGGYAGYVKPAPAAQVTQMATTTDMIGSTTVTFTTTSTPTITMKVMADFVAATTTTVTQATCMTTLSLEPSAAPVADVGGSDPGEMGHPPQHPPGIAHGGRRDVQLPDYVASYQPSEVSSACTCLASTQAAAKVTSATLTVTGSTDTVTQTYTTVFNSAVVQYNYMGATHTPVVTACVTAS